MNASLRRFIGYIFMLRIGIFFKCILLLDVIDPHYCNGSTRRSTSYFYRIFYPYDFYLQYLSYFKPIDIHNYFVNSIIEVNNVFDIYRIFDI